MPTIRYLSSIKSENFMFLVRIYVKLFLIEDTNHRWPGARQRRHVLYCSLKDSTTMHLPQHNIAFSSNKLYHQATTIL